MASSVQYVSAGRAVKIGFVWQTSRPKRALTPVRILSRRTPRTFAHSAAAATATKVRILRSQKCHRSESRYRSARAKQTDRFGNNWIGTIFATLLSHHAPAALARTAHCDAMMFTTSSDHLQQVTTTKNTNYKDKLLFMCVQCL